MLLGTSEGRLKHMDDKLLIEALQFMGDSTLRLRNHKNQLPPSPFCPA